jgi:hypothetical protein
VPRHVLMAYTNHPRGGEGRVDPPQGRLGRRWLTVRRRAGAVAARHSGELRACLCRLNSDGVACE